MTAPQPGDRVRVEYEATYHERDLRNGVHVVGFIGDDNFVADVPSGAKLTVLPKPLRVGDKVRLGEDPEPPVGTVLLHEKNGAAIKRSRSGWAFAAAAHYSYPWSDFRGGTDATVVWLPEVAS